MKVVYVAGKYRSKQGIFGVTQNIEASRVVSRQLWAMGLAPISPHCNSNLMDGPDIDDKVFLDGDLEILRRCDAVIMLPDWQESSGATAEKAFAESLGIPVLDWINDRGKIKLLA